MAASHDIQLLMSCPNFSYAWETKGGDVRFVTLVWDDIFSNASVEEIVTEIEIVTGGKISRGAPSTMTTVMFAGKTFPVERQIEKSWVLDFPDGQRVERTAVVDLLGVAVFERFNIEFPVYQSSCPPTCACQSTEWINR